MSIFEAVEMFGVFPSGLVLGLVLGAAYGITAPLRLWRVSRAITEFIYALCFAGMVFAFSVGAAGELRYYTAAAVIMGAAAERLTLGRLARELVKHSKAVGLITKTARKIREVFVVNAEI